MADPHAEQKEQHAELTAAALLLVYLEMRDDVMQRIALGLLRNVLRPIWGDRVRLTAAEQAKSTAAEVAHAEAPGFDATRMDAYLDETAEAFAKQWADDLAAELAAELEAEGAKNAEQALAEVVTKVDEDADLITARAANLATVDAAKENGSTTKTWHLGAGGDHRASHVSLDGVTIGIDERFANGLRFPRSPGPPAEVINCNCYLSFGR